MKKIFLFTILFLILISSTNAYRSDHYYTTYPGIGPHVANYKAGYLHFPQFPQAIGSGVYNFRTTGKQYGYNPYYASSSPATHKPYWRPNSHINRVDSLSEAIYRNPDLLRPRYITNWHRETKAFDLSRSPQHFFGPTGTIRSGVYGIFR